MTDPMTDPSVTAPGSERPGPLRRTIAALSAAFAALAVLLVLGAAPASAHSDDGKFEVVSATPAGSSSTITVKLLYTDDDPVADATVTVAGDNGAGATLTPVTLGAGAAEGEYTGKVDFPAGGTWNLRLTSVKPAAELALTQQIGSGTQATTEGGATATTAAGGPGSSTTVDGGVPEITAKDAAATEDSGTSPVWWVVGGVAVVAAVALGVLFVARGRNQGPID
jgi:hypothetical protein